MKTLPVVPFLPSAFLPDVHIIVAVWSGVSAPASCSATKMKVVTWNINGIRAFRGGIKKALDSLDADVICIQETKVTRKWLAIAGLKTRELSSCKAPQLEWNCMKIKTLTPTFSSTGDLLDERIAIVDGYNSYFSYSRGRSGYSGSIQSYITVHFASVSLESVCFFSCIIIQLY